MDISNLKEKAPEIKQGLELENMYEIGYRQLDCYKPLERLPEYPMDINSTKNQSLMKTLISQVVEELMEGYEYQFIYRRRRDSDNQQSTEC